MPQPWEMDWGAGTQSAPPAAEAKPPWEMDWNAQAAPKEEKSFTQKLSERFHNPPNEPSLIGFAGKAYHGLLRGLTLPGDVASGKTSMVDPATGHTPEDVIGRSADLAVVASPMNPAVRIGDRAFPGVARNIASKAEDQSGLQAARTATELGAPLPKGLASENAAIQSITQAARQLPGVGTKIDEQVGKTVSAAGEGVKNLADTLAGGVVDRTSAGANLRPSLQGVIEGNNSKINDAYTNLRSMIDPDKTVSLPRTRATLEAIAKERSAAGQKEPLAGLGDVENLIRSGATFNGLQRARSDIGNTLNFGAANPGFNKGDMKRIYGAMSGDMQTVAKVAARDGIEPEAAALALKSANETASKFIEHNKSVQGLLNIKSDEGLIGSVVKAASDKTGNAKLLTQLRSTMPKEDFEQIAGTALSELGHNPATNSFSLNQFTTKWNTLGNDAKNVLFSEQHRKYLDDIARLGKHLKDADKYLNPSGTSRAGAMAALAGAAGPIGLSAARGDVLPLIGALSSVAGGYVLASALARPAGAAAVARWTRSIEGYVKKPSPLTRSSVTLTTRDMITNLASISGIPKERLIQNLQASQQAPSQPQSSQPPQVTQITVHPKRFTDRVPGVQ